MLRVSQLHGFNAVAGPDNPIAALQPIVWIEARNLASLREEITGPSAPTPAVLDGHVGSVQNLGTQQMWLTAPANNNRPRLRQESGLFYFLRDQTNWMFSSPTLNFGAAASNNAFTVVAAQRGFTPQGTEVLMELSSVWSNPRAFNILIPDSIHFSALSSPGGGWRPLPMNTVNNRVFSWRLSWSTGDALMRLNGGAQGTASQNIGVHSGSLIDYPLFVGARTGLLFPFLGRIYSLFLFPRALSDSELLTVERYAGLTCGEVF